jgi:hypothetical protein
MNPVARWAFQSSRSYRRFVQERESFKATYGPQTPWASEADRLLAAMNARLEDGDLDGAWKCLHDARRLRIPDLRGQELLNHQQRLRQEVTKIASPWRRKTIEEVLDRAGVTEAEQAVNLRDAQALMDDYFETQYHKNGLLRDHLRNVVSIALVAIAALLLLIGGSTDGPAAWADWDWKTIAMVLLVGVLGASFSATRKLTGQSGRSPIPERVAHGWITVARIVLGAAPALAAYGFLRTGVVVIGQGNLGSVLVVAFAAGFSERFVTNLLQSLEGSQDQTGAPEKAKAAPGS